MMDWILKDGMYVNPKTGESMPVEAYKALNPDTTLEQSEAIEAPLKKILGMVGSYWGPVGSAAGNFVGGVLQNDEGKGTGQLATDAIKAGITSYAVGEAGDAAGSLIPSDTLSPEAAQYAAQPAPNPLAEQVSYGMGTNPIIANATPSDPSIINSLMDWGKGKLQGSSYGLLKDGPYTPSTQTTDSVANFGQGMKSGGDFGRAVADLRDGNLASTAGNLTDFAYRNYRPQRKRYY